MNFELLVSSIQNTHILLQQSAVKAINKHLTIRNWLFGFYIVEYEQKGEDRAVYGENLLQKLSERFNEDGLSYRNLRLYRQFYVEYPQLGQIIPTQLQQMGFSFNQIWQSLSAKLQLTGNQGNEFWQCIREYIQNNPLECDMDENNPVKMMMKDGAI